MYRNDTQETDIEIRTGDPNYVHFTNQQTRPGNGETTFAVPAPATMASAFHEYRYDWLPTGTNFYIDGALVMSINRNVPSAAGWLMWNSWSNGWAWTFGPPAQDNILLIRSVEAYFNRTSVDTSNCEANSGTIAATGTVVTSAGARITTNAAAIGNPPSSTPPSTTSIEAPSQTDDGTFNSASRMSFSARLSTESIETSEYTIFDDTNTNNTLQAMNTIGIASDPTGTLSMQMTPSVATAAYTRPFARQLLRQYTNLPLISADSI
jgi:hypothetical protein